MSSGVVNESQDSNDPSQQFIRLVRQGKSFSGRERNCLYLNVAGSRFANVSGVSGIDFADDARAAARVDWDGDGRLDLWLSNRNSPQIRFLRNQVPSDHRWISCRLRGTKSNRDGIGARIRVTVPDLPNRSFTRTLRAGDGYLTQSSKSVHIGLGMASKCDVEIRWPAGTVTTLRGLKTNETYEVLEGEPSARMMADRRQVPTLTPSALEPIKSTEQLQHFSMVRAALPRLEYLDHEGSPADLIQMQGDPLLVILWSSSCPACITELKELTQHRSILDKSKLNVVALNVDHLSVDSDIESMDSDRSSAVLEQVGFPFAHGEATEALIRKLQLVNDFLFVSQRPFPVPCSFLIDSDFRLAAIYRGRVDVSRIRDDLSQLQMSPRDRRDLSVPFNGIWAAEPATLPFAGLVLELMAEGFTEDASELVQRIQGNFDPSTILQLVVRLGMAHQRAGAIDIANRHFEMARKVKPDTVGPEIELGRWYESQQEYEKSIQSYRAALSRTPNSLPALNNLAWLLATCDDLTFRDQEQAVKYSLLAARLSKNQNPAILDTLATSLAFAGRVEDARKVADQAIKLAKQRSQFSLAREIQVRRDSF